MSMDSKILLERWQRNYHYDLMAEVFVDAIERIKKTHKVKDKNEFGETIDDALAEMFVAALEHQEFVDIHNGCHPEVDGIIRVVGGLIEFYGFEETDER